jgi:hypothetical protein
MKNLIKLQEEHIHNHCSNKCTLNVRLLKQMNITCSFDEEEFEDTKEVIRILISSSISYTIFNLHLNNYLIIRDNK